MQEAHMLIVAGTITVDAASIEKMRPAVDTMITETMKEEGCIDYNFAESIAHPGVIRVFEKWRSQGDLDDHFKTPHMAAFQGAMGQANVSGMDIKIYDIEKEREMGG
jgi:quinol monooxygenase YgiN